MATLTAYEVPFSWIPDPVYINSVQGIHYLAWQIGRDEKREKAIWIIEPVRDSPHDLSTLLPVGYDSYELLDDTVRYGHIRSAEISKDIITLQERFLAEVAIVEQEVIDGYR